jgi:hypothetical protein
MIFLLVYSWKRDHDFAHVGAYAYDYMSISLLKSDEFLLVYSWKRDHDFAHVGAYAWLYEHIIIEKLYYMPMAKLSSIKDAFL